jgi:hypothetical protein
MSTLFIVVLGSIAALVAQSPAERVLTHPDLPQRAAGHRLVAIRAAVENAGKSTGASSALMTVVLFDHTALEARRVTFDPLANRVIANELLPGRPQRSEAEMAEAIAIVRRDPALGRLIADGAVLDGGFIVADPGGTRRRMIQLKLVRADRRALLRTIVVDLTRGEIAFVTATNGAGR